MTIIKDDFYFSVIPVRGLLLSDDKIPIDMFDRNWVLVGHRQMEELQNMKLERDGLDRNIKHIRERLAPDALLLVRYHKDEKLNVWDERKAESILSAISMALLLKSSRSEDRGARANPIRVFRSRYKELCDLPLSFDSKTVRSTGHTGRLGVVSAPDIFIDEDSISLSELETHIATCPSTINAVLSGKRLNSREEKLHKAMRAIQAAFDTTTRGAFVASSVSAAELLVSSGTSNWSRFKSRLFMLTGKQYKKRIEEILDARHQYIHEAIQSLNDTMPFSALALSVQVWEVCHSLYDRIGNIQDAENFLDACDSLMKTESVELEAIREESNRIPEGPVERLHWIRKYLVSTHPNEYGRHYFIDGAINCASCGHINRIEQVIASDGNKKTIKCYKCSHEWEAIETNHI